MHQFLRKHTYHSIDRVHITASISSVCSRSPAYIEVVDRLCPGIHCLSIMDIGAIKCTSRCAQALSGTPSCNQRSTSASWQISAEEVAVRQLETLRIHGAGMPGGCTYAQSTAGFMLSCLVIGIFQELPSTQLHKSYTRSSTSFGLLISGSI